MKKVLFVLSSVAIMASCSNNKPSPAAETKVVTPATTDTAGLAQFQAWKSQNELATATPVTQNNQAAATQPTKEVVREKVVYVNRPAKKTTTKNKTSTSSTPSTTNTNSTGVNSSTNNNTAGTDNTATAEKKKGWSKTAKGAVIGGVGGAVLGGVINKRNRGAGAVIGGVLGAGAGAVIGRSKDKKDGRN